MLLQRWNISTYVLWYCFCFVFISFSISLHLHQPKFKILTYYSDSLTIISSLYTTFMCILQRMQEAFGSCNWCILPLGPLLKSKARGGATKFSRGDCAFCILILYFYSLILFINEFAYGMTSSIFLITQIDFFLITQIDFFLITPHIRSICFKFNSYTLSFW